MIEKRGDTFVIEVPKTWRITFGYVNPAGSSGGYARNEGHCLRVWEGQGLRAVFGNVIGFRSLDIPLAKKVERQVGESKWEHDSSGNFERTVKVETDSELVLEERANGDITF